MLDFCANCGMTLLPYSPLLGGAYVRADKSIPEQYVGVDTDARMKALREVANEASATLHQVVFAWMMHYNKPKILPVFSSRDEVQMKENLAASQVMLSDEQMAKLSAAGI
jgi:aryl-alcohol dehydrogenase-like predicted oxidoreductase